MCSRVTLVMAALLCAVAGACSSSGLEPPPPDAPYPLPRWALDDPRHKADVLFLVDNSSSMDSMTAEFLARAPAFFAPFFELAAQGTYADLHVGVVTSDYGAGSTGAPGCAPSSESGGGDQGKLIRIGRKAAADCKEPKGWNFVDYQFGPEQPVSNIPAGQTLAKTFTCMAAVGSSGCGFEHQLESVRAALADNIGDNWGFLREDALLAVVFVTNEDDGSTPPESDIFDKRRAADYGFEASYARQTRFAVMCGEPPAFPPYGASGGPLAGCRPAPNPDGVSGPGRQYDVARYLDLFTLPRDKGGLKDNPLDVVLAGLDAPEAPFEVLLSNPGTPAGVPFLRCPTLDESANPPCVPVLQHSCVNPRNPNFFGDPAVRLNSVLRGVKQHSISSICDDDYTGALDRAARLLIAGLGPRCLGDPISLDRDGNLPGDCRVLDVTFDESGASTQTPLPRCTGAAPSALPCWRTATSDKCRLSSPDAQQFVIERGSTGGMANLPPARTRTMVLCGDGSGWPI